MARVLLVAAWLVAVLPLLVLDSLVVVAFMAALTTGAGLEDALAVLRVAMVWPFVAGSLVVVFALAFHDQILALLRTLVVKLPGGAELRAEAAQTEQIAPTATAPEISPETTTSPLPPTMISTDSQHGSASAPTPTPPIDELKAQVAEARRWTVHWYLQFLSTFLVPRTKDVLRWLARQPGPVSYETYLQYILPKILPPTPPTEADEIMKALTEQELVETPPSRATLAVSARGRRFLEYLDGHWNPLTDQTIT